MRQWLANLICPEAFRTVEKYYYLRNQIWLVHRWCDGEAADAMQYLMDQEADHWRPLNAPAGARHTPFEIERFREWIYSKRPAPQRMTEAELLRGLEDMGLVAHEATHN